MAYDWSTGKSQEANIQELHSAYFANRDVMIESSSDRECWNPGDCSDTLICKARTARSCRRLQK